MCNAGPLCYLCGVKSKAGIEVFGYKGVQLSIQSILAQHFSIEITDSGDVPKIVCKKCWKITNAFHQLYCLVKDVATIFKCDQIPSVKIKHLPQTEVNNSPARLDYNQMKGESYDYNLIQGDVCTIPKPNEQSKVEIKEENTQQFEEDRASLSMDGNAEEQTKKPLTARQLKTIEQDKEIINSLAIVCELCDTTFTTFTELRQHFQKKHKVAGYIRCCGRKYKYRFELYNHIKHHKNPVQLQCSICERKFIDSAKLEIHMKRHDAKFKKIQCLKCPKLFTTKWDIKKHNEWSHFEGPKSFICDICKKSFQSKFTVNSHLLAVHVKKHLRICDMCGKPFVNDKLLDTHYKVQHLGIQLPKVQCNICEKWLSHKYVLRKHIRHHFEKDETCPICGKKATNRNALGCHIKRVHSGQIFSCTMCEKKFKKQKSLTEHFSTHTGFNLYQCKYCPREFNYESSLYKHRKDMHSIEVEEDVRKNLFVPLTRVKKINVENDPN